jgi:hypothetical protein
VTSEVPVSVGSDTVVTVDTLTEPTPKARASHPMKGVFPFILFYTLTTVTTLSDPYRMGTSHVTVGHGCHGLPLSEERRALSGECARILGVLSAAGPAARFTRPLIHITP